MVPSHYALHACSPFSHGPASLQLGRPACRAGERGKKRLETLPVPCSFPDPLRLQTPAGTGLPVMVALSVAEVRRLFCALLLSRPIPFLFRLAWSFFRRTHQAVARRCHYKRRLAILSHL